MPWTLKSATVVAVASASIGFAGWGWDKDGAAPKGKVPREDPSRRPSDAEEPPRPRDEATGPLVPVGPLNPNEYILPMDRSYLTREERVRLYQEPGVKFIRRGPKGSPFYDNGFTIEPYDEDQFHVDVLLGFHVDDLKAITPEVKELAEEAQRTIKAERPENPDRAATFPKNLVTVPIPKLGTFPTEYEPSIPLVRCGWGLWIRQIRPIPGGWWALVHVKPAARNEFYELMLVRDKLIEEYSFKDGRLTLERSYPDPDRKRDPTMGVYAVPAH